MAKVVLLLAAACASHVYANHGAPVIAAPVLPPHLEFDTPEERYQAHHAVGAVVPANPVVGAAEAAAAAPVHHAPALHAKAEAGHGSSSAHGSAAHGSAGAHGAGHGHGGGKDYASVMILVGVAFIMAIFYMVNSHHVGVPTQTWSMVVSSVSIFAAVMAYTGFEAGAAWVLLQRHTEEPILDKEWDEVYLGAGLMFFWFLVVMSSIWLQKASKLRLAAYGTIGGHILGFAAIDLYLAIAALPVFSTSPGMTLVVCLIYIVTIPILVCPVSGFFKVLGKYSALPKDILLRCHEQAVETSIDCFAMGLSKLLSVFFRGLVALPKQGHHHQGAADATADSGQHSTKESWLLFAIGFVTLLVTGCLRVVTHRAAKGSLAKQALNIICTTVSLTTAWVFIDVASWHFLHRIDSHLIATVCVALVNSGVFVLAVYGFSWALTHDVNAEFKRSLKSEFLAISLMVGLSWEHVFDHAVEGVGKFAGTPGGEKMLTLVATFGFLVVVFPAWVVYMLPKHDKELMTEYAGMSLAPRHAFSDCDPCGGGDHFDDEEYELGSQDEGEE